LPQSFSYRKAAFLAKKPNANAQRFAARGRRGHLEHSDMTEDPRAAKRWGRANAP